MASPFHQAPIEPLPEDEDAALAVDDDADSAFGSEVNSETTSISSETLKGYYEHGRRYQSLRPAEYYQPSDEKQWESQEAGHLLFLILDSERSNTLFRSPISPRAQHILDLGTGSGEWALDVADRFPHITIHGVDLYPPPHKWTAPNCIFEVEDITNQWTWPHKFDLIHTRHLLGSLNDRDFKALYRRCYDNLQPGGWFEQVEQDVGMYSDDGSLPVDSVLAEKTWRTPFLRMAAAAGRPLDTYDKMKEQIAEAGFVNVQSQDYKMPMGIWPSHPTYKDAGRVNKPMWKAGVEGWTMWLLTHFGEPTPWTPEEVQVFLAKARNELDAGYHIYQKARRVFAQKPFDGEPKAEQPEPVVESIATPPTTETATETAAESKEEPRAAKSASPESQGPTKKQKMQTTDAAEEA